MSHRRQQRLALQNPKQMASAFLQLPHHEKVKIAETLGILIEGNDEQTWADLFRQVRASNKMVEFDRLVSGEIARHGRRVHLYSFENVLRPRGSLEKESLSSHVLESVRSIFESWTDPKYGDSRPPEQVVQRIVENAREELETALETFRRETDIDSTNSV